MNLRNICIIAHVDHGKTTLVDHMLAQAGTLSSTHEKSTERVMDSLDLERERGITIQSKNAAIEYENTRINIIDTPGHADFGGEVERILGMVDGAILLVDGAEGPLPQTRFVLEKALEKGHRIILVINKVDRPECADGTRIQQVVDQTFDLFVDLGASEEQADFPILYSCARDGWSTESFEDLTSLIENPQNGSLKSLLDTIVQEIPPPHVADSSKDFQMLVSQISWSDYLGRLAIGRIESGQIRENDTLIRKGMDSEDNPVEQKWNVSKIYTYSGLKQKERDMVRAGDVAVVAGCQDFDIGDTLVSHADVPALPRIEVEQPTLAMIFSVNTSPFSGQEGNAIQSRKLSERLLKEARHNVAIRVEETDSPDQFRVFGRGELQFSILIEEMRREGLEFMVGRPIVVTKEEKGQTMEPWERATLDLPEQYSGDVTQMFQQRKGILSSYQNVGVHRDQNGTQARIRLEFDIPTRGLIGLRTKFLTATRGEGLFSTQFMGFTEWKGEMLQRANGALVSDRQGDAVEYALLNLEDRGMLFIEPGKRVYEGMVIGEFNKENDLNVNPCKEKKLTNVRSANSEVLVTLKGIRKMSLEECIEWIDEDEWIEVTPENIRLRKKNLKSNSRDLIRRGRP